MLPLLERARVSAPKARHRLLLTIKESLEQEARRMRTNVSPHDLPADDWKVVKTVANVLHAWEPPIWLKLWEESRRRRLS